MIDNAISWLQTLTARGVTVTVRNTLGSLDSIIRETTTRRDRAQRALDGFLQQAEQLLET